jgi:hypothetical protein
MDGQQRERLGSPESLDVEGLAGCVLAGDLVLSTCFLARTRFFWLDSGVAERDAGGFGSGDTIDEAAAALSPCLFFLAGFWFFLASGSSDAWAVFLLLLAATTASFPPRRNADITLAAADENVLSCSGAALGLPPMTASLDSSGWLSTEVALSSSDAAVADDRGELAADDVGSSCASSIDSSTDDRKLGRARLEAAASGRMAPPPSLSSSSSLALKSMARFLDPVDCSVILAVAAENASQSVTIVITINSIGI